MFDSEDAIDCASVHSGLHRRSAVATGTKRLLRADVLILISLDGYLLQSVVSLRLAEVVEVQVQQPPRWNNRSASGECNKRSCPDPVVLGAGLCTVLPAGHSAPLPLDVSGSRSLVHSTYNSRRHASKQKCEMPCWDRGRGADCISG
jgi:hypothetical protein